MFSFFLSSYDIFLISPISIIQNFLLIGSIMFWNSSVLLHLPYFSFQIQYLLVLFFHFLHLLLSQYIFLFNHIFKLINFSTDFIIKRRISMLIEQGPFQLIILSYQVSYLKWLILDDCIFDSCFVLLSQDLTFQLFASFLSQNFLFAKCF